MHTSGCFVLANAWDMPSAALIAEAGYKCLATSSAAVAFVQGVPDGEKMGRQSMLRVVAEIARRVDLPLSADLEAGYGPSPEAVAATVRGAITAGAVGCNIEDRDPASGKLYDFDLAVARIKVGQAAADTTGLKFVLNARTDPFLTNFGNPQQCFDESVRRANAYLAAGARSVFVPGVPPDTIGKLAAAIKGPLNVLGGFLGKAGLPLDELRRLGVRRVSLGGSLMLATYATTRRALENIATTGTFEYANGAISNGEMNKLMDKY
jgi:2-methylisocitrate lyase-like PEP mutase family enzyme